MNEFGSGYRLSIADLNRTWFADPAHQQPAVMIGQMIAQGWSGIMSEIEKTLPVEDSTTGDASRTAPEAPCTAKDEKRTAV
jgi:hypothetical protein